MAFGNLHINWQHAIILMFPVSEQKILSTACNATSGFSACGLNHWLSVNFIIPKSPPDSGELQWSVSKNPSHGEKKT